MAGICSHVPMMTSKIQREAGFEEILGGALGLRNRHKKDVQDSFHAF
jgi:hypothetical protein